MSPSDGKEFEKLGAEILEQLNPVAQVKWNDHIEGKKSQTKRQIDISIRAEIDGHEILVIVETKDWATPASLKVIDAFSQVVIDVEATKGILVCKSGFSKKAKVYARNLEIDLINFHDAVSRDWNQEIKIPVLWIEYLPQVSFRMTTDKADAKVYFKEGQFPPISTDRGRTFLNPIDTFEQYWNEAKPPITPNLVVHLTSKEPVEVKGFDDTGTVVWIPAQVSLVYRVIRKRVLLGYFQPSECKGLIDYSDGDTFTVSHYPPDHLLPSAPESDWHEIESPEKVAITIRGTYLTVLASEMIETLTVGELTIS